MLLLGLAAQLPTPSPPVVAATSPCSVVVCSPFLNEGWMKTIRSAHSLVWTVEGEDAWPAAHKKGRRTALQAFNDTYKKNREMRAEVERRWNESSKGEDRKQERGRVYQEKGGSESREEQQASYFGEISEATLWANGMEEQHSAIDRHNRWKGSGGDGSDAEVGSERDKSVGKMHRKHICTGLRNQSHGRLGLMATARPNS